MKHPAEALHPLQGTSVSELATHLQRMREEERADLARELHDELGALLTRAKLDVAGLKLRLDSAPAEVGARLQHLGDTINSGIAFSRRVVEGLHPSSLEHLGLAPALEILAREFQANTGIATSTDLQDVELDAEAQLTVYRLVQEALNNTSKYAAATSAWIALIDRGPDVLLAVRDNGAGFDMATRPSGHGLAGMHHRVKSCAGVLMVTSSPGHGTFIAAMLPQRESAGQQHVH